MTYHHDKKQKTRLKGKEVGLGFTQSPQNILVLMVRSRNQKRKGEQSILEF